MEIYTITLKINDGYNEDSELDGYHLRDRNVTFAIEPRSGIFTFYIGRPEVINGHGRAWSCGERPELAFGEFYALWKTTGQLPEKGEFFMEEK